MPFVVVLTAGEEGVYSLDPDCMLHGAVAVSADNSVRPLPWSLHQCVQKDLEFAVFPSRRNAEHFLRGQTFERQAKKIELLRRSEGKWPEVADEAMKLVVDWLNLISPQYPVQLQYGETCCRCPPFCVCLCVVSVCALIHSCLSFLLNKPLLGIRSGFP